VSQLRRRRPSFCRAVVAWALIGACVALGAARAHASEGDGAPGGGAAPGGDQPYDGGEPTHQRDDADQAAAPVSATSATRDDPAPQAEIVVVGEAAVDEARRALVAELARRGWHLHKERSDGTLVFKNEEAWKGALLIGEHGSTRTRRPVVYGQPSFPVVVFNVLPSNKKLRGVRKAVIAGIQPELAALQEALQGMALQGRLSELPARLDALWTDGTPLDGGEPIPDLAARRAAVLDFWATRTETADGRAVQQVVGDWLHEVVMRSEAPLTAQEIAEAEARRHDGARVLGEGGE